MRGCFSLPLSENAKAVIEFSSLVVAQTLSIVTTLGYNADVRKLVVTDKTVVNDSRVRWSDDSYLSVSAQEVRNEVFHAM